MNRLPVPPWPEERLKKRRALKETVFALIYGAFVPQKKREAAEKEIQTFDEESARLYPEIAVERARAQAYNRWLTTPAEVLISQAYFGGPHVMSGDDRPR